MSVTSPKKDIPPSSASGTQAVRSRLREMLADAVRNRSSLVVVGSIALALLLTFVLAPLLSLVLAGLAGAGVQMVLTRFKGITAQSGANPPSGARLGAAPAVNLRALRRTGDDFDLFCSLAALTLLGLGAALSFSASGALTGLVVLVVFGALLSLLLRR